MISDDRLAELIVSMQGNVRIGSVADHVGDALMELRDRRRAALTPPQAGEDAADQASRLMVAAIGESPAPSDDPPGAAFVQRFYGTPSPNATTVAGTSAAPTQSAPAQEPVAWQTEGGYIDRDKMFLLRNGFTESDLTPLYAAPQQDEAVALLRELVRRYDDYRGKGMLPAPGEYQMVVGAIERIRAFLKDRT